MENTNLAPQSDYNPHSLHSARAKFQQSLSRGQGCASPGPKLRALSLPSSGSSVPRPIANAPCCRAAAPRLKFGLVCAASHGGEGRWQEWVGSEAALSWGPRRRGERPPREQPLRPQPEPSLLLSYPPALRPHTRPPGPNSTSFFGLTPLLSLCSQIQPQELLGLSVSLPKSFLLWLRHLKTLLDFPATPDTSWQLSGSWRRSEPVWAEDGRRASTAGGGGGGLGGSWGGGGEFGGWGGASRKRLLLLGRRGSPDRLPGGGGTRVLRTRLGFFLHAWLWAASGSSAQVFNLSLSVDEGLPTDTLVGDIRAGLPIAQQQETGGFFPPEDSDDSPLLDDFHVHLDSGISRTARCLDRERQDRYSFVAATLLGAVVQVEIRVNDVNDHSPVFPRDSLQLDVCELSPPGTAFRLPGGHDPDAGLFSTQGYTLVQLSDLPGDPEGSFFQLRYGTLGPPSPSLLASSSPLGPMDLVLLRRLDREAAAAQELQIEAWDGGHPRRTGRLRVELRVLDENDNPPVFEQAEYRAAVREDPHPGAEVSHVRATDCDLGPNGHVRYRLRARQAPGAGGEPLGYAAFFVEKLSGVVRVQRPLDREAQAWHQLLVEAWDRGAEPEVTTVSVSIAVLEVNDNQPAIHLLFLTEGGAARVSEGAPGDYVALISVSDADGDLEKEEEAAGELSAGLGGGGISLSLEGGEGAFALRPGGSSGVFFLCVQGPLDRENRVVATDAGIPPLSTEEMLLLRVADLNDQPPLFSQEHHRASVSEASAPGTAVVLISASDANEPGTDRARLRYPLIQPLAHCIPETLSSTVRCGPYFTTDPESGVISTMRTLDPEVQETVELKVVAQDLGEPSLSATCRVSVTVDDVNDNEPIFRRQVYNATVAEHSPVGRCFLQVKASDADAGLYGFVEYSLYDGFQSHEAPRAFQIDPHDGQIRISQDIDREVIPATYDLLVKAKDGGGLSAQALVRVELDTTEPVFIPLAYVKRICGQTQPGTEIISTLATNRDSGVYGTVAYELIPGDLFSLFIIDSTTGMNYLTSTLSHLESTTLLLMVCARDGGGLTSAINADVTIHILPTSLVPAVFERSKYTFSVYEDVPEGSPVGTVKAREPLNSREPIFYRITSGSLNGKFTIHPWQGTICTQKPLDHETQPVVVLTVQTQLASSSGYSSTEVNITVLDINDNHPAFLAGSDEIKTFQFTPPGTALYLARAEDKDSGLNGFIQYSVASHPSIFTTDRGLGVVCLNGSLGGDAWQKHTLMLMAKDLGVPPQASLLVLTVVIEKQESSPPLTFENLVYQVEISESLSSTTILQIQAYSLGPQHTTSQLMYLLEPSVASAVFGISPYTGWIYRQQLNYESTQTYNFRVFAWIPEDRLLQNVSTSVIVRVLDENDNSPNFLHDVLFLKVKDSPVHQGVIGKITAVDRDSGKNGQLSYFLLSFEKFFKMNPNTGELIGWVALDCEHQAHHQATVLVTDHGSSSRNAMMVIYISVTDINDNKPYFPQCLPGKELHVKVLEGQPVNMLVTTVFAKDLNEGNNGEVIYSVSSGDGSDHLKIDANGGELRTTTVLSYDYRPSYRMTVIASDQGTPPLEGQAVVNIQVLPQSQGSAVISQNIRRGYTRKLKAKPMKIMSFIKSPDHLQQHHSGKLHFCIVTDNKDGHFEINGSTGDLFLSKELDYEMTSHYLFRVVIKDHSKNPPLNSTVFLNIDMEDQNDHSPSFQDEFIVISIEENVPVGTLVYVFNAKDGDGSFLNSRIQYFIESHHPGMNPFLIHLSFGTLVTASLLDRESVPTVILKITASNQAVNVTDRQLKSLMVKVVILDMSDHSPMFMSFPIAHIKEDATVGSVVHHITAQDPDEGRNGRVTYSILSGNENMTFVLDESSGPLTTTCPLDHEIQTQHILTLLALNDGILALSSSQTLTITVLDINDKAPVFKPQNPREFVIRVEATDRDSGINSKLQFETMPGASFGLFDISPDTGEVVTAATLDREIQERNSMSVLVRDGGIPSLSSTTMILCTVEDESNHAPEFIVSWCDTEVPENEPEVIYTVLASDMDAGNNGAIKYYIIDGNTEEYFTINETSGKLSTTCALDQEQINNFAFVILCSDLGDPPRSFVMQLQVTVLDDNDHSLSFLMLHYQSSVREDTEMGAVVLILSAMDEEEGPNGQIEYFLMDEASGAFIIDPVAVILRTAHTLDQEARSQHTFRAVARDCSIQGSRSTTVIINVHVTDVNDNDPIWGQNPFNVFFSPQLPANLTIASLRADDPDLGLNGTVIFSFAETQSVFSIDKHTGEIQLQQSPPSEYFPIWLQLKVMDQGVPARTTTGLLVFHMDGEDVKLSFTHHLYEGIVTNCETGTSIVTVKAFTPDSTGGKIKYLIFSGNEDGVFSLCSNSGELTVKEPKFLDFEVRNEIQLIVLAEKGGHRAYIKVAVLVQDVNDNLLCFERSVYHASVSEGQFYNAHIIQVFAADPDSGLNSLLEYSILSGNQGDVLQIDALSDEITTNMILDYKSTGSCRSVHHSDQFDQLCCLVSDNLVALGMTSCYLVEASDGGVPEQKALALVEIEIQDMNSYAPEFTIEYYNLSLSENALIGGTFITFSIDHDWTHENTHVEYSIISSNSQKHFSVETSCTPPECPYTQVGYLVLLHSMDREVAVSHQLVVLASVHGCPPLSSIAIISVEVLDVNDNPPKFTHLEYHAHVKESTFLGSHITVVSANDSDMGSNAEIIYHLISGNERGYFHLEEKTGVLHLIKPLDYEETAKFTLTVQASDEEKKYFSFAIVFVNVLDDNDHTPQFMFPKVNCLVLENLPVSSTICSVNALDFDTGPYGELTYSILSPCFSTHKQPHDHDLFLTDPFTGDIQAKQILAYELENKYCIIVQVKDKGDATAFLILWVDIERTDEFEPIFTQDQYFFNLSYKSEVRQLIGKVEASDADAGIEGIILYSLGTTSPFFSVNKTNGNIYLTRALPLVKSYISKEDIIEMNIIAHSPKLDFKFTSCTVFVNVSFSPEGKYSAVSANANSFSISLRASFLVFLLLVFILIILVLRHKQKDTVNNYEEKKTSSSLDVNLRLTGDANTLKAFQKTNDCSNEAVPVESLPEWLSFISIMEKDIVHLYGHSNSSSHCYVEGETAEDKEIQRINEHSYRKDSGSALIDQDSRVPDSGIPRDSDQLSCLSGETDLVVTVETETRHTLEDGDGGGSHGTTYIQNDALPPTLQKRGVKEDILADVRKDYIFISGDQEARGAAPSTQITSDHDVRDGGIDCLLCWEPKFPLASVFNDIAKLKDEHLHMPGLPKDKKCFVFPQLLITAVASGIRALPPRMPATTSGQVLQKYPYSPILYHLSSLPEAMTPSFSPSLSLLTIQTPAMSPLSSAELLGTHLSSSCHEWKSEDEAQI
ncbi:LOW QUALITY PROTEIN: protocadherin-23 [Dugong dugon]